MRLRLVFISVNLNIDSFESSPCFEVCTENCPGKQPSNRILDKD